MRGKIKYTPPKISRLGKVERLSHAINQISTECALLVIAHRYSTVRTADQVFVLDHGEVIAAGTHQHLLDTNSYYRNLATGWLNSPHRENTTQGPAPAAGQ